MTPASSSSRNSSAPSRSRSRSRSSASAAARRSARGASPSYMWTAIHENSSDWANGDAWGVSTATTRTRRLRRSRMSSTSAGRSKTSLTHSRVASSRIGNDGYLAATESRSAARWRCCHSGVRWSGRCRGSSSARAAHSRNREANIEVSGRRPTTRSRTSSGLNSRSSTGTSSIASGSRMTIPSSPHIRSTSMPQASRSRALRAIPQGAWTWAPKGVSTHTRQSPISSRNRSTTMVRSSGTAPVTAAWSAR